jgi:hypothetical protein
MFKSSRFLIASGLVVVALAAVLFYLGLKPSQTEGESKVEESEPRHSRTTQNSEGQPGIQLGEENLFPSGTAPADLEIETLTPDELLQEFDNKTILGREQAMAFARFVFFESDPPDTVREKFLEGLHSKIGGTEDFRYLTREILGRPEEASNSIFTKALHMHLESLEQGKRARFIYEMLERTPHREHRELLHQSLEDLRH